MDGEYIATFYSHFGAISFKKLCDREGAAAKIMPVPRSLSSSCGTCVRFTGDAMTQGEKSEELEQIVKIIGEGQYQVLYHSDSEA